jgi:hypothetical protein
MLLKEKQLLTGHINITQITADNKYIVERSKCDDFQILPKVAG